MAETKVPRTIYISAKCSDLFSLWVKDENNQQIGSHNGYVPKFLPGVGGDYFQMEIDIETGQILKWKNPMGDSKFTTLLKDDKKVPTTISLSAKCSDGFWMSVKDSNGKPVASYSGYVPSFMPEEGGWGDYVKMDIGIETGRILNWTNPTGDAKFTAILNGLKSD